MLPSIQQIDNLTMSSIEIAELTGKRHDNVMADIRNMFDALEIRSPEFSGVQTYANNRTREVFNLPKDLTITLVSGYNVKMRHAITTRWIELEMQQPKEDPVILLAQKVLQQDAEIKTLEKTKAQINDKRTATIMGRLGNAKKEIKKLESQLQDVGDYISEMGAKLPKRTDTPMKDNVQTWRLLKQLSCDMQLPPKKVKDSRYGEVNAYHVDVIERFKDLYL